MKLDRQSLEKELQFKAVRSSGSGGQHINKTSTKIELRFKLKESNALSMEQIEMLQKSLGSRLTNEGELILHSGETRSQHRNKMLVLERFFEILQAGLEPDSIRISTKTPRKVKRRRLEAKRRHSDKKQSRKPPDIPR